MLTGIGAAGAATGIAFALVVIAAKATSHDTTRLIARWGWLPVATITFTVAAFVLTEPFNATTAAIAGMNVAVALLWGCLTAGARVGVANDTPAYPTDTPGAAK